MGRRHNRAEASEKRKHAFIKRAQTREEHSVENLHYEGTLSKKHVHLRQPHR